MTLCPRWWPRGLKLAASGFSSAIFRAHALRTVPCSGPVLWIHVDLFVLSHRVDFAAATCERRPTLDAVQTAISRYGHLSILVNSAAGNSLALPEELNVKGLQTAMDIDTMGVFNMCSQAPGCSSRCDSQSVALALCTELSSPQEARQGHNHQHQCHVPDTVPCGMIGIA